MARKKILIVDDEPAFTNIVKLTLEGTENYEVRVENDPCRALATGRKFWPDIIILDVIMPGMNGDALYRYFLADPVLKHVPVIFLTAVVPHEEVDERNGMIGRAYLMAKPVSADQLAGVIDNHLRKKEPAWPHQSLKQAKHLPIT